MESEVEKYRNVLNLLRSKKPEISDIELLTGKVMDSIRAKNERKYNNVQLLLFGWTEIAWVRRTMVAASVALVFLFAWQQGSIMKQLSYLKSQASFSGEGSYLIRESDIERGLLLYRLGGKKYSPGTVTVSREKMDQLLKSVDELQKGYDELIDIISRDTVLKKVLDEKQIGKQSSKTKI
jgi:hypothetical protein